MLLRFFLDAGASGPATPRRRRASGIGVESGKLEIPEALRAADHRQFGRALDNAVAADAVFQSGGAFVGDMAHGFFGEEKMVGDRLDEAGAPRRIIAANAFVEGEKGLGLAKAYGAVGKMARRTSSASRIVDPTIAGQLLDQKQHGVRYRRALLSDRKLP